MVTFLVYFALGEFNKSDMTQAFLLGIRAAS